MSNTVPEQISGSVLSAENILLAIENGDLSVSPFEKDNIHGASLDLRLGKEFRIYKEPENIVSVKEDADYKKITDKIVLDDKNKYYDLKPQTSCLGVTKESLKLSNKICAFLSGRSRFARIGLFIHFSSNFIQPGIEGPVVLEIFNSSNHTLRLFPDVCVCQVIFLETKGEAAYNGQFQKQIL
ncbi:dctp deaminase [Anaeramoeba ignava]|uniref:Dctp deaminase n=1 Tax=Anaeramoeba ignava TaxID=1746090 RepID=A0A9Q0LSS3_ANAIG|nr:dctp deaminase [Anaeramoeba ignava]